MGKIFNMADSSSCDSEYEGYDELLSWTDAILGYQFEPIRRVNVRESSEGDLTSSDDESSEDERPERAGHNRW